VAPNGNSSMAEMKKANGKIPLELSIPQTFRDPATIASFLQFKRDDRVETASFDAQVD
jgi:hypothetical protein